MNALKRMIANVASSLIQIWWWGKLWRRLIFTHDYELNSYVSSFLNFAHAYLMGDRTAMNKHRKEPFEDVSPNSRRWSPETLEDEDFECSYARETTFITYSVSDEPPVPEWINFLVRMRDR